MIEFKFINNILNLNINIGTISMHEIFAEHIYDAVFGHRKKDKIKYLRLKSINQEIKEIISQNSGTMQNIMGYNYIFCDVADTQQKITESLNAYLVMKKLISKQ